MTAASIPSHLLHRIHQHARDWNLIVDESFETDGSVISYVSRNGENLVLKLVKREGDEWNAGDVVSVFEGNGMVRVYEYTNGAMLLERLQPGTPLLIMALDGRDEEATDILAGVIKKMWTSEVPDGCRTNTASARGFERYLLSADKQIPRHLVECAQQVFSDLGTTQSRPRLLHGDLQHYNVLFDSRRGWIAIDPKGVIGEVEYEIGPVLFNPVERAEQFLSRPTIERRLRQFTDKLAVNYERMLAWSFARAVLSAIWDVQDGFEVDASNPSLRLAELMRPMLSKLSA
jgi:streptomycin 6-kinase